MRVQTEEWRRFIPGVRMYKGKKTLFWNGEILYDVDEGEYCVYDQEEQKSWEVIIVLPGVEVIPEATFSTLQKIETVIMSDSVRRIEDNAFGECENLSFAKLSRSLECIGEEAFYGCYSLPSIFIPPSCREIGHGAFADCHKLIIVNVPRQTQLGENVIVDTALIRVSSFEIDKYDDYDISINDNVNEWIKNINGDDAEFALHRACSSFNPMTEIIYDIAKRQGLKSFKKENQICITPLEYLEANPFAEDIDQSAIVKRYVLEMMGEGVIER
ncbi:hypothetical protein CTEN210_06548 [Chaetoceros tenuissimus]|uniref:Leucine-rich repeat domain-containing protein n=1 Tax=Chaetoceros tenuissimus TaxID=426638 RepID=A0AAD3H4A3_9STRA|nr:hypothetical protein CTEN210_06548 [Chaetoceros tenuissimus]